MLNHIAMPESKDGIFRVGYVTPGCNVMTVVCECRTERQAVTVASEFNVEQLRRQAAVDAERAACARRRIRCGEEHL